MKKEKISSVTIAVSIYLIIHGCFYIFSPFFANIFSIWNGLWAFLFGNATLSMTFIFLPMIVGALYTVVGIGLLFRRQWAGIGLAVLCIYAMFFEFPIGTIIGMAMLIYSFTPSFSKIFPSKTKKQSYQWGGLTIFVCGLVAVLIMTGFASGFVSFTTYKIRGYDISYDTAESKIEDIPQRIGVMNVLIELTASPDYALEQQDILLTQINGHFNRVVNRFTEVSNAMVINLEASNLLVIAENKNVVKISPVEPSFQFFPYELTNADIASTIPQQLNVDGLWAEGITGKGITIAIMDTGIKENHPDLQRNGQSIVVGGLHLHGEYVHPHGTMVASCIASQNPAYKGIAPDVNLLNIEVFHWENVGGIRTLTATNSDILQGFEFVANWKKLTGDFVILSCSWGVSALSWMHDADVCTEAANRLAIQHNIIVIASTGNSGPSHFPHIPIPFQVASPSGGKNVLSVGAVDYTNAIAGFSSRGPYYTGVGKPDVVAPGVNVPVFGYNDIITVSGTSFSCPYVSGVTALLAQDNNDLSSTQLYDAIRSGATDLGAVGYDYEYGYGLVNAQVSMDYINQAIPPFYTSVFFATLTILGLIIMLIPVFSKKHKR